MLVGVDSQKGFELQRSGTNTPLLWSSINSKELVATNIWLLAEPARSLLSAVLREPLDRTQQFLEIYGFCKMGMESGTECTFAVIDGRVRC